MSRRGKRTSANVRPGQFNPDPESQWKLNQLELDQERSPKMEGRSTRAYLRWKKLFGIPIPVGLGFGLKIGGSFSRSKPKHPLPDPLAGHMVWSSEKGWFVKPPDE